MDAAAAKFENAQADFMWDVLQSVVQEHDIQTGTIYFQRKGAGASSGTAMAAYVKQQNGQNAPKTVTYTGGELQLYQPGINQLTIIKAGANQSQYESFLTLGFGGSGKDLETNWEVSCSGMETIAGTPTAKLELKPKQASVANTFSHVTVWIDPTRAVSLKQVFVEPSGDTRTATYSNIKVNTRIDPEVFKIKTRPDTQIVRK
jgi:outer membrane lipoprotein-sorting protein